MEDLLGSNGLWAAADLLTPMAIRVAATLRIADDIGAPDLAEKVGANPAALDRLLRHLESAGVVHRTDTGYVLTELGEALRSDHPSGVRDVLDVGSALGRADLCFVSLAHSVRTGGPAFPLHYGQSFWEDLDADEVRAASFNAQMASYAQRAASDVVNAYDWGSLTEIVDVGGGNAITLSAILKAFPDLRGTVFDLPSTTAAAAKTLVAAGLANRADVVSGSFFDGVVPSGAGGYLLSAILHDWDDVACRTILRRCADAAGEKGKVFVIEWMGDDSSTLHTEMDLRMLAYYGSRERDVPALTALAAHAGLEVLDVHQSGVLTVLELGGVR